MLSSTFNSKKAATVEDPKVVVKDEKHSDSEEYEDSNSEKAIESKSDVESNKGSDKDGSDTDSLHPSDSISNVRNHPSAIEKPETGDRNNAYDHFPPHIRDFFLNQCKSQEWKDICSKELEDKANLNTYNWAKEGEMSTGGIGIEDATYQGQGDEDKDEDEARTFTS